MKDMQQKYYIIKTTTVGSITLAIILHAISKYYVYLQSDVPHTLHLLIAISYFSFVVSHSLLAIGKQNTIIFFSIVVLGGGVFEFIKTSSGYMKYSNEYSLKLLDQVPLIIPFWIYIISYIAFSITSLIAGRSLLEKISGNKQSNIRIFLSSIIDSFIVLGFLLIAAPIDTAQKEWIWMQEGVYYGVPISFYIIWFFAMLPLFSSYRFTEKYYSFKRVYSNSSLLQVLPVVTYTYLIISGVISSILNDLNIIAFIGFFTMIPYVLISFLLFFDSYREEKNTHAN